MHILRFIQSFIVYLNFEIGCFYKTQHRQTIDFIHAYQKVSNKN